MDKKTKYDHLKQLVKSQHNLVYVDVDAFVIGSLGKARLNLLPEGEVRERMTKCPSCSSKHQSCGGPQATLPRLLTHCPLNSHADCHAGRQDETQILVKGIPLRRHPCCAWLGTHKISVEGASLTTSRQPASKEGVT